MKNDSAGILLYRVIDKKPEYLLIHPGGPFWKKKDLGAWSIPKGECMQGEDPLHAAIREFTEETGHVLTGNFIPLTPVRQKAGKLVRAWAIKGNMDTSTFQSNTFEMEWPPKSGKKQTFPEADQAQWFALEEAREKINAAQRGFLEEVDEIIKN